MPQRSQDWFRQAEADLRHAKNARDDGDYDWSAFASHQAAEEAIKAVYQFFNLDAWSHMLSNLLASLPVEVAMETALVPTLLDQAKELDKHYIPTRYPNGFERGAPTDFYTRAEAERAISHAETIVEFCRHKISR